MPRDRMTFRQLLSHPDLQGLIPVADYHRIESSSIVTTRHDDPLYMRTLMTAGAWLASIFLILFLLIAKLIADDAHTMAIGVLFLIVAIVLSKISTAIFVSQFSLSLAFCGNGLVLYAIAQWLEFHNLSVFFWAQLVITLVMIPLYDSRIFRYVSPLATVILAVVWIYDSKHMTWMHIMIALEMAGLGAIIAVKRLPVILEPVKYAVIEMLPLTILFMNLISIPDFHQTDHPMALWPSGLILTAGLLILYRWLMGSVMQWSRPDMIILIASTVLLGLFSTPGILVAIGLMILGYTWDDRRISNLAYLFLACFLVIYYYSLDVDLAVKSGVIGGSGLVLLAARYLIKRWAPAEVSL